MVGGVASRAPGDVELQLTFDPAVAQLGKSQGRFWRVGLGALMTLSESVELTAAVVAQQPAAGGEGARLERLHGALEFRVLGRTPDGAPRGFESKLVFEYGLPLLAADGSAPSSVRTSHVLDERVILGGASGLWSYGVSLGLSQALAGARQDDGVGGTFGVSLARALAPLEPWPRAMLGLEVFGDVSFDGPTTHGLPGDDGLALYAGPTMSFALGRVWGGLGLYPALAAPELGLLGRVMFGFAL